jgi:hypothetical protein
MAISIRPVAEVGLPDAIPETASPGSWFTSVVARRTALVLGIVLLVASSVINARATITRGEDFDSLYVVGRSLLLGFDVYQVVDLSSVFRDMKGADGGAPWGLFYPPSLGVFVLPVSLLPFSLAKMTWALLLWVVLLTGVNKLLRMAAPNLPFGYRLLILGGIMSTSVVRWGFISLQPAPLIFGLLGFYMDALARGRTWLAVAIAAPVVCLKFTLALPFLGLAFVQRRYGVIVAAIAVTVVVMAVGFARLGGMDAIAGYQNNMARIEAPDQLNYPDFRAPNSMQRLDWPYLLNAFGPDLPRSNAVGLLLTVAAGAWLLWEWRRARDFAREPRVAAAFLGPLVCLSLLSVYHHHYDAIALLGPCIIYVAQFARHDSKLVMLYVVPVVLYAGLFEAAQFQSILGESFGPESASYLKLVGVVCVNIAFGASLLLLRNFLRLRRAS